jgi:IS30 family transposase
MRDWKQVHVDAGIDVYFCDPHPLAARLQREHQRAAAAVLPQGAPTSARSPETSSTPSPTSSTTGRAKRLGFANPTEQLAELLLQ